MKTHLVWDPGSCLIVKLCLCFTKPVEPNFAQTDCAMFLIFGIFDCRRLFWEIQNLWQFFSPVFDRLSCLFIVFITMKSFSVFLTACTILTLSRAVLLNSTLPRPAGLCQCDRQMCSKFLGADFLRCGVFCPQCDTNGNFFPKHGLTGYCWCVDIISGCEIPNTRTPPGTEPDCGEWSHVCVIFLHIFNVTL